MLLVTVIERWTNLHLVTEAGVLEWPPYQDYLYAVQSSSNLVTADCMVTELGEGQKMVWQNITHIHSNW